MMATLSKAAGWMDGTLHGQDATFAGVSIDSRTVKEDDLFFAISGPNFDGHDYAASAADRGAAGVVVERDSTELRPVIHVEDSRRAIGKLAHAWRRQFSPRVIGLTGSNGKTTLKTLITAICGTQGVTLSTEGNLNNELGVPLMLLRMRDEHAFAVIEMGANHVGEIEYLTSLVEPNIVVLNNAGPAHLEGFGSMDGVARGKGEILEGMPRPDVAILNADDAYYDFWRKKVRDIELYTFGLAAGADVSADNIDIVAEGSTFNLLMSGRKLPVRLSLPGMHNVRNACAAAAVGQALGIAADAIVSGLERAGPVAGRLVEIRGLRDCRIFDDSYNANPSSVRAAAEFLVASAGHNIVVLGDMFELGSDARLIHKSLGRELADLGVDALYATGELSRAAVDGFGTGGHWFASHDDLIAALQDAVTPESRLIIKGSRSMKMEQVVDGLRHEAEAND